MRDAMADPALLAARVHSITCRRWCSRCQRRAVAILRAVAWDEGSAQRQATKADAGTVGDDLALIGRETKSSVEVGVSPHHVCY
jgi:hypothetical protein